MPAAKSTSVRAEKKSKIAKPGMESRVILCTCRRSDLAFEDILTCPMTATGLVGPNLVAVVAVFAVSIGSKGEGRRRTSAMTMITNERTNDDEERRKFRGCLRKLFFSVFCDAIADALRNTGPRFRMGSKFEKQYIAL